MSSFDLEVDSLDGTNYAVLSNSPPSSDDEDCLSDHIFDSDTVERGI